MFATFRKNKSILPASFGLCLAMLLLSSCSQNMLKQGPATYKNTNAYNHPEIKKEDMAVFIVGVEGPNPLSFVRICTKENVGQWTDHRLGHSIQPGEVFVIEQPNSFEVRRLCAYSKDRYANYVGTHLVSAIVKPGEQGPGLYYLGSVKTPDSVKGFNLDELYHPEITDTIKQELQDAVRAYPNLAPKNFTLE